MGKTNYILICILSLLLLTSFSVEQNCVVRTIEKEVGIKEATGNNDGKRVEEYLRTTNLGKGFSWCASFVKWAFLKCGIKTPITAWSPTAHNSKNIVYFKNRFEQEPKPGDVFTIYSINQKRIVHTGFFYNFYNSRIYETIEGNTNNNGSSNGDGVYKRKRSYHQTYSITRWL